MWCPLFCWVVVDFGCGDVRVLVLVLVFNVCGLRVVLCVGCCATLVVCAVWFISGMV